ncbi:hypothetical protein LHYA1_G000953 [Lachnellula hyalina]|uniref:Uncharacterized protein n=1 Tax=Lachnellula hyalina TaxID=1316788 RepID=A0A8H8R705_9HELO|nr:uncharacterized protein LHYA1_G000953 [Lachnellula hyalina]TVY29729.1 hypothetical protein LHYA1_G000953 [Lachnellula hyalina]
MPPTTSIPRFLLPKRGLIWSKSSATFQIIRHASKAAKGKPAKKAPQPILLEKPAKFNPPSHPARKWTAPRQYPGRNLSKEEEATMKTKQYPKMMPPPGTFMHWFLHNKSIHLYITLGTLSTLAFTVWFTNFQRNSPFAHMLPAGSQFFLHPIAYTRTFFEVLKLTSDYNTQETIERRRARVEDVAKRDAYRKAHGMDKQQGFGGWTAKSDDEVLGSGMRIGDGKKAEVGGG